VRVPKEKHRRNAGRKDRKPLGAVLGAPWPEERVRVLQSSTKSDIGNRATVAETTRSSRILKLVPLSQSLRPYGYILIVGVLFLTWSVAEVWLFVGGDRRDTYLLSSITGAVLSFAATGLAYRSSRIAARVEGWRAPETSDWARLRAHETESFILIRALEVFGDSDRAIQWLAESNPALQNEPPIRVIQTDDGRREVLNILGRIQHGVIS
jgi:hypothetical protein